MPYEKESALFVPYCMVEQKCEINPSTFPGLTPGICSGLILSSALHPVVKEGFGAAEVSTLQGRRTIKC
jgi:hypothetical protein